MLDMSISRRDGNTTVLDMSTGGRKVGSEKGVCMDDAHVDVIALHAALDAAREAKGLSWRELARALGLSPSTMSRLANKKSPDVNAFMTMVGWLNMPAEAFWTERGEAAQLEEDPELTAQLAPLLRARRDLDAQDVDYLQELIGGAMRRFKANRVPRPE
jgi:transcriptional regulator with XRE-family HTH domain